ncbi:MAG: hypothetical protein LBS30_02025 [Planctomycetota bacterium]|nr:hypothetical protein [Planctomycetota bacterium]
MPDGIKPSPPIIEIRESCCIQKSQNPLRRKQFPLRGAQRDAMWLRNAPAAPVSPLLIKIFCQNPHFSLDFRWLGGHGG